MDVGGNWMCAGLSSFVGMDEEAAFFFLLLAGTSFELSLEVLPFLFWRVRLAPAMVTAESR